MRDRLLIHYVREILEILSLDGRQGVRRNVFVSYTRLFWRYILAVKFSSKQRTPVKLGRYRILPPHFGVLRHLYEELFIERNYDIDLGSNHPVIIDCGSNIGMSVLFFKDQYPQARITAFEPDPENFAHLQSTVSTNFPDVTIHNMAVAGEPGRMQLFTSSDSQGKITTKSLYRERLDDIASETESVEVVRLSDFVRSKVDLLKIDVEGAEVAVLRDLITTGTIKQVRNIIVEFHEIKRNGTQTLSGFLATLEQEGFVLRLAAEPLRSDGHINVPAARDVLIYASRPGEGTGR